MRTSGFSQRASGRTLLVVEDDPDIRASLDGLLSMEGFHVAEAPNGRAALEWLRTSPKPDMILLDLMMPVMDGWQFRIEQKRDPELANIPVVAFSADATPKAEAIDAEAYLAKPVDYDALVDTIDRLLVQVEHKELQSRLAQADRLRSLGTLAAGVAHEINNPLAYVLLNLSFVDEQIARVIDLPAGEPSREKRVNDLRTAARHAREGAERIRDIVRGLKTFSRPESDRRAPVDVTHVMEASIAMVHNELRHRARLTKRFASVPVVVANEARLGQVFLNLLLNAVQALPDRASEENLVEVTVRAPSPDRVVVEVRDNGVGIPPQVRGRLFEPFFTTKPVGIGTGLGLAICHGIVTSYGGTLSFESEPGQGSVFRVELPAAGVAAGGGESQRPSGGRVSPVPSAHHGRILVVDDEPIVCFSLERLLSTEGEVATATSGRAALARIAAGERFDVILCDLLMPEMDGAALYEAIRELAPEQAKRMVFVTGGAFTARARDFLDRVPNSRVGKPFDVDALVELVRKRLG